MSALAECKADVKLLRQQIAETEIDKMTRDDLAKFVKTQLADNLLPLFEAFVETIDAKMIEHEDAIGELDAAIENIEGDNEGIHPETAEQFGNFIGIVLAYEKAVQPLVKKADDVTKRKLAPLRKHLLEGAQVIAAMIADLTIKPDDDAPATDGEPEGDVEPEDGEDAEDEGAEDDGLDVGAGGEG